MAEGVTKLLDSGQNLHGSRISESDSTDQHNDDIEQDSKYSLFVAEDQACRVVPKELTDDDPRSHEIVVEQWIQREWAEHNDLQMHLSENPQSNEIPEGQTLLGEGIPPAYEDDYFTGQVNEHLQLMWDRMVYASEQKGRHYIRQLNVRAGQRIIRNDVMYEVPDFLEHNVFASVFCCCPLGWLGLIFSMLCQSAKSEGKRKLSQCLSVTAGILFALSVISGMFLITIFVYYRS